MESWRGNVRTTNRHWMAHQRTHRCVFSVLHCVKVFKEHLMQHPGKFQKNPRAHKNKIGTPPPPPPKHPPKKGEFYGHGFSCRKNAFFPGVHKIGAPISGPRITDTNFTDTRIFLKIGHCDMNSKQSRLWLGRLSLSGLSRAMQLRGENGFESLRAHPRLKEFKIALRDWNLLALFKTLVRAFNRTVTGAQSCFSFQKIRRFLKLPKLLWGVTLDIMDQKLDQISSLELESLETWHFVRFLTSPQWSLNILWKMLNSQARMEVSSEPPAKAIREGGNSEGPDWKCQARLRVFQHSGP